MRPRDRVFKVGSLSVQVQACSTFPLTIPCVAPTCLYRSFRNGAQIEIEDWGNTRELVALLAEMKESLGRRRRSVRVIVKSRRRASVAQAIRQLKRAG